MKHKTDKMDNLSAMKTKSSDRIFTTKKKEDKEIIRRIPAPFALSTHEFEAGIREMFYDAIIIKTDRGFKAFNLKGCASDAYIEWDVEKNELMHYRICSNYEDKKDASIMLAKLFDMEGIADKLRQGIIADV
jgi:hypothetical protein